MQVNRRMSKQGLERHNIRNLMEKFIEDVDGVNKGKYEITVNIKYRERFRLNCERNVRKITTEKDKL